MSNESTNKCPTMGKRTMREINEGNIRAGWGDWAKARLRNRWGVSERDCWTMSNNYFCALTNILPHYNYTSADKQPVKNFLSCLLDYHAARATGKKLKLPGGVVCGDAPDKAKDAAYLLAYKNVMADGNISEEKRNIFFDIKVKLWPVSDVAMKYGKDEKYINVVCEELSKKMNGIAGKMIRLFKRH